MPVDRICSRRILIHGTSYPVLPLTGKIYGTLRKLIAPGISLTEVIEDHKPLTGSDPSAASVHPNAEYNYVLTFPDHAFRNIVFSRRILICNGADKGSVDIRFIRIRYGSQPELCSLSGEHLTGSELLLKPDGSYESLQTGISKKCGKVHLTASVFRYSFIPVFASSPICLFAFRKPFGRKLFIITYHTFPVFGISVFCRLFDKLRMICKHLFADP